jgi:hypothetical protein
MESSSSHAWRHPDRSFRATGGISIQASDVRTVSLNAPDDAIGDFLIDVAVVKILVQLAHWAEANCKDDMTTFLSSGFQAATTARTKTPLVSEAIRKIVFGSVSGEVVLTLVKFKGAASYEVRWASVAPGTANPTTWSSQPVTKMVV